jgi:hypothetical protein
MRAFWFGLFVVSAIGCATFSYAKPLRKVTQLIGMDGSCENLEAFAVVLKSGECQDKVINANFSDGRLDFTFFAHNQNGDAVFSFSGDGRRQIKTTADDVTQPIDAIIATFAGTTTTHSAAGTCHYSNPYKGKASVSCKADTDQGMFAASFLTDGKDPTITNMKWRFFSSKSPRGLREGFSNVFDAADQKSSDIDFRFVIAMRERQCRMGN